MMVLCQTPWRVYRFDQYSLPSKMYYQTSHLCWLKCMRAVAKHVSMKHEKKEKEMLT